MKEIKHYLLKNILIKLEIIKIHHNITLLIPTGEGWHYPAVKIFSELLREITFIVLIVFIPLENKVNFNRIEKYVKIKAFVT